MAYTPPDPIKQAEALKRWLEADPEQAAATISAGLVMLAIHGYATGSRRPVEWGLRTEG